MIYIVLLIYFDILKETIYNATYNSRQSRSLICGGINGFSQVNYYVSDLFKDLCNLIKMEI